MQIQMDVVKELWNVSQKTKFSCDDNKIAALEIFEAMVYQPVERMRPLQIGEKLLSNILNNCRIGVSLRRRIRKILQIISASLQPVVKEVKVEVVVVEKDETDDSEAVESKIIREVISSSELKTGNGLQTQNGSTVEPVKITKITDESAKISIGNVRVSGQIEIDDVIPAKILRGSYGGNESTDECRASAFINKIKADVKGSERKTECVEISDKSETMQTLNDNQASIDDMLA